MYYFIKISVSSRKDKTRSIFNRVNETSFENSVNNNGSKISTPSTPNLFGSLCQELSVSISSPDMASGKEIGNVTERGKPGKYLPSSVVTGDKSNLILHDSLDTFFMCDLSPFKSVFITVYLNPFVFHLFYKVVVFDRCISTPLLVLGPPTLVSPGRPYRLRLPSLPPLSSRFLSLRPNQVNFFRELEKPDWSSRIWHHV